MKNITKYMLLLLTAGCTFAACEEEDDYQPASSAEVAGMRVWFDIESSANLSLASNESSFDVTLHRSEAGSALSVPLKVTANNEIFTVPAKAEFAADSKDASLTIGYDFAKWDYVTPDTITLEIDDPNLLTPYGVNPYQFIVSVPLPFKSLGFGTITEAYFFSGEKYTVEFQQNSNNPTQFRIVKPFHEMSVKDEYATDPAGIADDYLYFTLLQKGDKVGDVEITMDDLVVFDDCYFGYYNADYSSDMMLVHPSGFASLQDESAWTKTRVLYYQENGLPAQVQLASMYYMDGVGAFNATSYDELVILTFPGVVELDFSLELTYNGKFYDAEDNLYISATASKFGSDVAKLKMAVCPKGAEEDLVAKIEAGEVETVDITAAGTVNLPFDAESESGKYSVVAVVYDAEGAAQSIETATFTYTSLTGEPVETWTPYYIGNFTYNPNAFFEGTDEGLVLYGSDDDEIRCKIGEWGMGTDLVFLWDEEDVITTLDQEIDYQLQGYDIYVADMNSECIFDYCTWAEFITANYAGDCDGTENTVGSFDASSYVLTFNNVYYGISGNSGAIVGWGLETYELTANAAPSRRGAKALTTSQFSGVSTVRNHALRNAKLLKVRAHMTQKPEAYEKN